MLNLAQVVVKARVLSDVIPKMNCSRNPDFSRNKQSPTVVHNKQLLMHRNEWKSTHPASNKSA